MFYDDFFGPDDDTPKPTPEDDPYDDLDVEITEDDYCEDAVPTPRMSLPETLPSIEATVDSRQLRLPFGHEKPSEDDK